MLIYTSVCIPTLLYGSESWTMLDQHISQIKTADMRYIGDKQGEVE